VRYDIHIYIYIYIYVVSRLRVNLVMRIARDTAAAVVAYVKRFELLFFLID
jgi:hypothetical protein